MKQVSKIIILLLAGILIMIGLSACGEKIPENRTKEQYELEKEFQPLFDFLAEEKKDLSNVKIYYSSIYITDRKTKVKRVDRAIILEQFKTIYRAENLEMVVQALEDFVAEWKPKYRKVMESLENTDNLLTFYQSPYQIWHGIYSTNLIESLNKEIKRQTKKKVLFPNEETLERYLVTLFEDYNFKQSQRIHKGFGQCSDTLKSLFD